MKIKMLAIAISGVLLAGCNDSNGDAASFSAQAFDPAIYLMNASASCTDGTTESVKTDFSGNAKFNKTTIVTSPETCTFTFNGDSNSVDVTNGKSMNGVTYVIPKGLAQAGKAVTGSPFTTLIAKELNGAVYSEATAELVLGQLGLDTDDLANKGVSVSELLLNTQSAIATLPSADSSIVSATTAVLSDVLKNADSSATTETLAKSADAISDQVITDEPNYPDNGSGTTIVVTVSNAQVDATVADAADGTVDDAIPTQPTPDVKPEDLPKDPDATGGTGGTGSNGSNGA